jgi:hypothetical protein
MGPRERRVERDGPTEVAGRLDHAVDLEGPSALETLEIRVVGFGAPGARRRQSLLIRFHQRDAQRLGDPTGDVRLDGEDVVELPVVGFRPEVVAIAGVDQLCRDPNPLALPPDTSLEHVAHTQLLADLCQIDIAALERKRRGARCDLESGHLCECIQELLGQPVREVLVGRVGAQVHERQDGDRSLRDGRGPGVRTRPEAWSRDPDQRSQRDQRCGGDGHSAAPRKRRRAAILRLPGRDQPIHADRLWDVLDLPLAEILEPDAEPAPDLPVDLCGNCDPTGLGQPLDARRDVHPVSVEPLAVGGNVAEVDADAKLHASIRGEIRIALREGALHRDRRLGSVEGSRELRQHVVAGRVDDATALRSHDLADLGSTRL